MEEIEAMTTDEEALSAWQAWADELLETLNAPIMPGLDDPDSAMRGELESLAMAGFRVRQTTRDADAPGRRPQWHCPRCGPDSDCG